MDSLTTQIINNHNSDDAHEIFDRLRKAFKAGQHNGRYYVNADSFTQTMRKAGVVAADGCYLTETGTRIAAHLCS